MAWLIAALTYQMHRICMFIPDALPEMLIRKGACHMINCYTSGTVRKQIEEGSDNAGDLYSYSIKTVKENLGGDSSLILGTSSLNNTSLIRKTQATKAKI